MRYAEYHKALARLDSEIAKQLDREVRAANGAGPWFLHLFPDMRGSVIDKAAGKRAALAQQRAAIEQEMFGAAALMWNANAAAVFRRSVPTSGDAIATLRAAADAALVSKV
jgi:stage V sporulation protein SpoVS